MNIWKLRHYIPVVLILAFFIGVDACSNGASWSATTFSCTLPPPANYPPLSEYINSIHIANQNSVSVPGPILEYGVPYELMIKFSVPIAGFPITVLTMIPAGTCTGEPNIITAGPPSISTDGLTIAIPITTPASQSGVSGSGCPSYPYGYQINICGAGSSECLGFFSITTVNAISYQGTNTHVLAGGFSFNVWLNNLDNDFPYIMSFLPGYPAPIDSYPPPVPASGYFPPHSPINVVFSEVMMGGTSMPISMLYSRNNASEGDVFTPSELPEISFTRTDTSNNQTVLISNGLLEPASEYMFTFLSAGNIDLYHNLYGNQDSSGMPLFPYVNTVNCAQGDKTCIENAYWTAIENGIPNDLRAFNTSLVGIEGPSYPAFSGFNYRDAIYVTPTSLSLNVTGSTGSGVSAVLFTAESYLNGSITPLGSTSVTNNQYSASVPFTGLTDGPYYFVAQETTDNSYDLIPVVKDTVPPSAPGSVIISPTDMSIDNMQDLNSVCATANTWNIGEAQLYIVDPNNQSTYITSVTLPANMTSSQGYQFCFSNIGINPTVTDIGQNEAGYSVNIPAAGIYTVEIRFVDFGGLESAAGIAQLKIHPEINYVINGNAAPGSSYDGCPGQIFTVYGDGFNLTNTTVFVNGIAWPTTPYIVSTNWSILYGQPVPTSIALSTAMPSNAISGYITVATNGVASVPGTSPLTNTKVIVPWAIDKYVDTGYTPVGISIVLGQFDYPRIASTDGNNLYYYFWNGTQWITNAVKVDYVTPFTDVTDLSQSMSSKISLALDQSGNPDIAYAKLFKLPNGQPAIGLYFAYGTKKILGSLIYYSFNQQLIDTLATCTYQSTINNIKQYSCDNEWLSGNYSISIVYNTSTGNPVISYRGLWSATPAIISTEISSSGNMIKSEVAPINSTGGFYSDMKQDESGDLGIIFNTSFVPVPLFNNNMEGGVEYAQQPPNLNWITSWVDSLTYLAAPYSLTFANNTAMASTCVPNSGIVVWNNSSNNVWSDYIVDGIACPYNLPIITSLGYDQNNGELDVSYYDSTKHILKMATGSYKTWLPNIADIGINAGTVNSVAIDSNGKADIAYSDNNNGRLLFFQEANGNFISTNPNYVNSPTSCDVNKFSKISIPTTTIDSFANSIISNPLITLPFPLNLFSLNQNNFTMFLLGALDRNDTLTIDQNNNTSSYTLTLSNSAGQNIGDGETLDITVDLNALQNNILNISTNFMDVDDTLFSSVPHNMLMVASTTTGLTIEYTVDGLNYGTIAIGNGSYLGSIYGLSKTCPSGSTAIGFGACDISKISLQSFLTSFFPIGMGNTLELAIVTQGINVTKTSVEQYFSNNTNMFTSLLGSLQQINGYIPQLVNLINQNGNGYVASHAYITLSGVQHSITGDGSSEGVMNLTVPIYAEVWGIYHGYGIRATCPGTINLPLSPNPYTSSKVTSVTASDITSTGIDMFGQNPYSSPFSYNCSLHYTGTLTQADEYLLTHLFDVSVSLNGSTTTVGNYISHLLNSNILSQDLTNDIVTATPLSVSLTTPQFIDSLILSTNNLDVYMESK